jgi:hypothetical protein
MSLAVAAHVSEMPNGGHTVACMTHKAESKHKSSKTITPNQPQAVMLWICVKLLCKSFNSKKKSENLSTQYSCILAATTMPSAVTVYSKGQ